MRTVAVVLAAGSGQRFGGELPKQLQRLAGRTLIEHSVGAFQDAPGITVLEEHPHGGAEVRGALGAPLGAAPAAREGEGETDGSRRHQRNEG